MASLKLPDDLRKFLEVGEPLVYDEARATPKGVSLLPLDQLMQRRANASNSEPASATPVPMTNNVAPRSRDREAR